MLTLIALAVTVLPRPASAQRQSVPLTTDSALVQHLRKTDPFFTLLVRCKDAKLTRTMTTVERHGEHAREHDFTYSALCDVTGQEEDDCLYRVELSGTIDTPESATIRRFRWDLVCGG